MGAPPGARPLKGIEVFWMHVQEAPEHVILQRYIMKTVMSKIGYLLCLRKNLHLL